MNTHRIATLQLHAAKLASDLATLPTLNYTTSYNEFVHGELRIFMLYSSTGSLAETHVSHYSNRGTPTPYWDALPYISQLIAEMFDLSSLKFARILQLCPNSVLFPHRDLLGDGNHFCRIHIPIQTDAGCYAGQDGIVFQMFTGEVWYLDVTRVHSAASFSPVIRSHVVLDFAATEDIATLLRVPPEPTRSIPTGRIVHRARATSDEKRAVRALAALCTQDSYPDIMGLLIKWYFRRQMHASAVFDWAAEIAKLSRDQGIVARVAKDRASYLADY
jgi:hypothetical protein